jgi:hypothetical protein
MTGIFDRLQGQLDDDDQSHGITPMDIVDLPDAQRQVMKLLLRDRTASTEGIGLDDFREKLPGLDDLPAVIDKLAAAGWLIVLGEPPTARYKINLRKKRGTLTSDLWSSLAGHLIDDE